MPTAEPRPRPFGIWIELPPDTNLRGEGIFSTLVSLVSALAARDDTEVVFAAPRWAEGELKRLLRDHRVDLGRVRFVFSRRGVPIAVRLHQHLFQSRPRGPGLTRQIGVWLASYTHLRALYHALKRSRSRAVAGVPRLLVSLLSTDRPLVAACVVVAVAVVGLLMVPFALLGLVVWLLAGQRGPVRRLIGGAVAAVVRATTAPRTALQGRVAALMKFLYLGVVDHEYEVLARRARRRRDVAAWLVPHPAGVHAAAMRRPLVVAVPDIVYREFPTVFDPPTCARVDRKISALLPKAAATVSYSAYVSRQHVVAQMGVETARARVIPHASMAMEQFLEVANEQFGGRLRDAALALVRDFALNRPDDPDRPAGLARDYLVRFPFDEIPFLFVCSQVRPHKNYANLLRGFEILLRRRHRNLKLLFTARLGENPALADAITASRLELDALSVRDVPVAVLGAFYQLATLTVVPTLFEGGFPFPFTESLSVGTPVVMSSIPVTREVVPDDVARLALFDPYDAGDIATRVGWALDHRDELLARERALYDVLSKRTWPSVADEYRALLFEVAAEKRQPSARSNRLAP